MTLTQCILKRRNACNWLIDCCVRWINWKPKNDHFDPHFDETPYGSRPRTQAGGKTLVTLVPGMGGIGQWEAIQEIISCAGAPITFELIRNAESSDDELDNLLLAIQRNGIAVKGNIETRNKVELGVQISRNMLIRKSLDLFVRVNWIKTLKPLRYLMKVHDHLDIVLIRQNTEGEFSMLEYSPLPEICQHLSIITRYNSLRIAEYSFNYARTHGRKKITLILNKDVVPESEEIFAQAFLTVAERYPDIIYEVMDVTRFTLKLQYEVKTLDVLLASSLIGSILGSVLQGFLGSNELTASLNSNGRYHVWEAAYISTIQKSSILSDNPISHICIIVSILNDLGAKNVADAIFESMIETLTEGVKTRDLGGTATIQEFTRFMITCLKPKIPGVQCSFDSPPKLPPKPPPTKPFHPDFMPGMVPPNPNYKETPPELPPGEIVGAVKR